VFCTNLEKENLLNSVDSIFQEISNDEEYKKIFLIQYAEKCGSKKAILQNLKWENKNIYEESMIWKRRSVVLNYFKKILRNSFYKTLFLFENLISRLLLVFC